MILISDLINRTHTFRCPIFCCCLWSGSVLETFVFMLYAPWDLTCRENCCNKIDHWSALNLR